MGKKRMFWKSLYHDRDVDSKFIATVLKEEPQNIAKTNLKYVISKQQQEEDKGITLSTKNIRGVIYARFFFQKIKKRCKKHGLGSK
jgi:hypothetical protein